MKKEQRIERNDPNGFLFDLGIRVKPGDISRIVAISGSMNRSGQVEFSFGSNPTWLTGIKDNKNLFIGPDGQLSDVGIVENVLFTGIESQIIQTETLQVKDNSLFSIDQQIPNLDKAVVLHKKTKSGANEYILIVDIQGRRDKILRLINPKMLVSGIDNRLFGRLKHFLMPLLSRKVPFDN